MESRRLRRKIQQPEHFSSGQMEDERRRAIGVLHLKKKGLVSRAQAAWCFTVDLEDQEVRNAVEAKHVHHSLLDQCGLVKAARCGAFEMQQLVTSCGSKQEQFKSNKSDHIHDGHPHFQAFAKGI